MGSVLVISRDPDVSHAVCTFLSQYCHTQARGPGPEAERLVAEADVDVIIADVKTPEAEELQFVRTLKRRFSRLPIVFLSLYASQLSRSEDRELFYDAVFFPKPFDNQAVAAAVDLLRATHRQPAADNDPNASSTTG